VELQLDGVSHHQHQHPLNPIPNADKSQVFSDVLDNLVETAVRDSVRLAAHRGSKRVELKDMAFVFDDRYQIVVPGFNAQVPKRVHIPPDEGERRRGKAVMRRPARREDE
jgi:transcription initiation factor TFIID subunit TAF12